MGIIRIFLSSMLVLSIFSCTPKTRPSYRISEKEALANEITLKVAHQLKKEKGLVPIGTGGGMMNQIWMLSLSFNYYRPVTIEEGRELLIAVLDCYADAVNSDARIHPYLKNYPFRTSNFEIFIFLKDPSGAKVSQGDLSILSSRKNILEYEFYEPGTGRLKVRHKETYAEALDKMKPQQNQSPI